jgi:hypothetical protein
MLRFLKKDKDGPGPPVKTPVTEAYNVGSLSYIIPNSDGRASRFDYGILCCVEDFESQF